MDIDRVAETIFPRTGRRAVVLCGGRQPATDCLERWLRDADLFLAADGSALQRDDLPRPLDAVIGDLDSMPAGYDTLSGPPLIHQPNQSTTDTEKTLRHAIEQGCTEAVLLGAVGKRLDHTLYNCTLLEVFAGRIRLALANRYGLTVRVGPGESVEWPLPAGLSFSLAPLNGSVTIKHLDGAAWPLAGETLSPGGRFSISNLVQAPPLRLTVAEGALLATVVHEPDDA